MRYYGKVVDIIETLAAATKATAPGSLASRVQNEIMCTALELDAFDKLNKAPGRRTVAQLLIEAIIGGSRDMPETGWKEEEEEEEPGPSPEPAP